MRLRVWIVALMALLLLPGAVDGLVAVATVPAVILVLLTPLESVSALYMLPGLVAAVWYGTGPAIAAALLGADIATIPYKVIAQLAKHPLTDIGMQQFLADWDKRKQ